MASLAVAGTESERGQMVEVPTASLKVDGRDCDSCTLCCSVLGIDEIRKPPGLDCPNCTVGWGCRIYEMRPQQCREFHCGFLLMKDLGEEWRPSRSRIIIVFDTEDKRVRVHVDPAHPEAWRAAPYYARLKQWSAIAISNAMQVVVRIGERAIVVLPERDVDLGDLADGDEILVEETHTPSGVVLDAIKVKKGDPRIKRSGEPSAATMAAPAAGRIGGGSPDPLAFKE